MPTSLTPQALLTLAQWLSPAFPTGAFGYSHGLEWAVQSGDVTNADQFTGWASAVIRHGAGRNDVILLAEAYRAKNEAELTEIDALSRALSPAQERLLETAQQGAAFAQTVAAVWGRRLLDLTYPVAVGAAAQMQGLPLQPTAQLYLHSFIGNLAVAASRLVPLGQTDTQSCLAALASACLETAEQAIDQGLDDLGGCAFAIDIASMKHETQYSRLFRS